MMVVAGISMQSEMVEVEYILLSAVFFVVYVCSRVRMFASLWRSVMWMQTLTCLCERRPQATSDLYQCRTLISITQMTT